MVIKEDIEKLLILNNILFRGGVIIILLFKKRYTSIVVTFLALTLPSGQKDTGACELVASAAGSNICTLIIVYYK